MRKVYRICTVLFLVITGLLIPADILLHSIAFNTNYYPLLHLLFLFFLVLTFLAVLLLLVLPARLAVKRWLHPAALILVAISFLAELYFLADMLPYLEINTGAIIFLCCYFLLIAITAATLAGLWERTKNMRQL